MLPLICIKKLPILRLFSKDALQVRYYKTNPGYKRKPKLGNATELLSYQERRVRTGNEADVASDELNDEIRKSNSLQTEEGTEQRDNGGSDNDIYAPYLQKFSMISNSVTFETKYTDIDELHPSTKENQVTNVDWIKDKKDKIKLKKAKDEVDKNEISNVPKEKPVTSKPREKPIVHKCKESEHKKKQNNTENRKSSSQKEYLTSIELQPKKVFQRDSARRIPSKYSPEPKPKSTWKEPPSKYSPESKPKNFFKKKYVNNRDFSHDKVAKQPDQVQHKGSGFAYAQDRYTKPPFNNKKTGTPNYHKHRKFIERGSSGYREKRFK